MADGSSSVRAKQSTAANFKANCHTEKGKQEISGFLDGVLSLQRSFDVERQEWCLWLIAGGKRPEEFRNVLLSYDTPTICGLVWNKNFVAYRCRDCGISPCMSLCADCFHAGNHEGHDFNMFKSQAGGACDCGDEDVMKKEGCVNSCFFIFIFISRCPSSFTQKDSRQTNYVSSPFWKFWFQILMRNQNANGNCTL